jgi:polysaccharide biosynthesis protein PslH
MNQTTHQRRLRVLVIDEEIPYPLNTGKRIRTWNLLTGLAKNHDVHLLCYGHCEDAACAAARLAGIALHLVEPSAGITGIHLYLRLFVNLFSLYPFSVSKHYSRRFQKACDALLRGENWDLIQCEWTPYARFLSGVRSTPTLLATHNVESQIWERRAQHGRNLIEKLYFRWQEIKMRWFERSALRRASAVTAVSGADAETMQAWGVQRVTVVPNGVDFDLYSDLGALESDENAIISVSSLDWFPNVDAIEYFSREIYPIIRQEIPYATLRVVGRRPSDELKNKLASVPGVELLGEVADVRPHLERAAVVVVPLRIGGGSRLKILEALASAKAVVSTSVGVEGLELRLGEDLMVADSPLEFAKCVVDLLRRKEARKLLGEAGRRRVSATYDWGRISGLLEAVWLEASAGQPDGRLVAAPARESHVTS